MVKEFPRRIEDDIRSALSSARVVVVTGPRQVGKTTSVRRVVGERAMRYLDDETTRTAAISDPHGFIADADGPIAIDEVQLGSDALIRAIKSRVDLDSRPGQFLLNGSADFLTVPRLTESLAGRAVFLTMWPLSLGEQLGGTDLFLDSAFGSTADLRASEPESTEPATYASLICAGGFPEAVLAADDRSRNRWFSSYVRSIATRDISSVADVRDADLIPRLLRALAARTAGEFVPSRIADTLRADFRTVDRYVTLLEMIYAVHRLPAWSRNLATREARKPKVHITDSGLAAHLMRKSAIAIGAATEPARGPLFETFVVGELIKQASRSALDPYLFHYRDHISGSEVDVVAEAEGAVVGIEVKASRSVTSSDVRHLSRLRDRLDEIEPNTFRNGILLHAGPQVASLGDRITAMPISALWSANPPPPTHRR